VSLHERSPVIEIDYGARIVARTPQGSVAAARVILAVNSFAPRFGFYGGRIFPMRLYASLTRPLDEAEQRALGAKPWAVISTHPGTGCTMRYTEDHRILIRHIGEYGGGYDPMAGHQMDARRVHMDLFRRRFPMLPKVEFAHTWAGFTCMSRNFGYGFSKPADNVFTAVCENGVGATNSTMAGALAAERAYAIENPLIADFEAMGAPAAAMPEPLLRLGVGLHMRRVAWEGRAEV
jgi:glycine/D-amino acid oxidase-like deaminating enzyme